MNENKPDYFLLPINKFSFYDRDNVTYLIKTILIDNQNVKLDILLCLLKKIDEETKEMYLNILNNVNNKVLCRKHKEVIVNGFFFFRHDSCRQVSYVYNEKIIDYWSNY